MKFLINHFIPDSSNTHVGMPNNIDNNDVDNLFKALITLITMIEILKLLVFLHVTEIQVRPNTKNKIFKAVK